MNINPPKDNLVQLHLVKPGTVCLSTQYGWILVIHLLGGKGAVVDLLQGKAIPVDGHRKVTVYPDASLNPGHPDQLDYDSDEESS